MKPLYSRPLIIIFPLLLVVLISGCTSIPIPGLSTMTSGGVTIVDFNSDFPDVYVGDTMKFSLRVRNMGSVEATDVFAELLGLDEDWFVGGEKFPNENECRYDGSFFTLSPPQPEYSVGGEAHTCSWTYDTPEGIPKGMSVTYDATARVYYTYQTNVMKTITLISYDKMKELQQQGKTLVTDTVSQTSSPISITAVTRSPIRISENKNSITFPLEITIQNVGGGVACITGECKGSFGEESKNKILLKIESLSDGLGLVSGGGCEDLRSGKLISVWPGKSNKITCDLEAGGLSQLTGPAQKPIKISAEYSYYTESTIPITVSSPY